MATKTNKSLVKNTARGVTLKGNTTPAKSNSAKTNGRGRGRKTVAKRQTRSRRYRRNSATSAMSGLLPAAGGALVINLFDYGINKYFPSSSGLLRTVGKFGLGFVFKTYGSKMPLVGAFAPLIGNSLYLAGFLDVVSTYVMPRLVGLIDQATSAAQNALAPITQLAVAQTPVTDPATGQLGSAYRMQNGDVMEVYRQRALRNRAPLGGYTPAWAGRSVTYA